MSCRARLPFDERAESDGVVTSSHILIWNFSDQIHPQMILEAPGDVFCFRFNATDPSIVAAGCVNGQVMFFKLPSLQEELKVTF